MHEPNKENNADESLFKNNKYKINSTKTTTTKKPTITSTAKPTPCSCTCAPTTRPVVVNGQTTKKPVVFGGFGKAFSTYENQSSVVAGWGTTSSGIK